MKKNTIIWKNIGETPLQATERFRSKEKLAITIPLAYAGRLDPMAEGKLLMLIGDECKKIKSYIGFDKEYEFEILFGLSSDSGDVLGLIEEHPHPKTLTQEILYKTTRRFLGKQTFPYPRFSSKTVYGKQLHKWTLENRLHEIEIPTRTSTIYSINVIDIKTIQKSELEATIIEKIGLLLPVLDPEKGLGTNFRREPILARWKDILKNTQHNQYQVARFRAVVSSGTYIRTLSEKISESLGSSGLAYSITRTKIGRYTSFGPFKFWTKRF